MSGVGPRLSLNLPNALTMLRLLLVPLLAWILASSRDTAGSLWALVVFAVASLTDLIDGHIARTRGQITAFGELWDPIADKALTGVAFISLSILGELPWWVTIIIMVREIVITWMRFTVIGAGVVPANRGGKLKTTVQMLAISMLLVAPAAEDWLPSAGHAGWMLVASALVYAAAALTLVTGLDYIASWRRLVSQLPGVR
ncbi:MAG: hypothetical protein RL745_727 [Actinomycetota bacterium]|jgi:CDP-diacylglycerol--glycerol-3-phosphate 3-phosphatidyltransferase